MGGFFIALQYLVSMGSIGDTNRKNKVIVQLGMSPGKARPRLVKSILFSFAQQLHKDTCFRCGKLINTIEEFSIEHKQNWLDVDARLYWDLNNIAFSHLKCNKPHRLNGGSWRRKQYPEGMSWCCVCKDWRPVDLFYKGKRWNGLSWTCKPHQREAAKKWNRNNRKQKS